MTQSKRPGDWGKYRRADARNPKAYDARREALFQTMPMR